MIIASYSAIIIIAINYLSKIGGWQAIMDIYDKMGYSNFLTQMCIRDST